ncbi:MAG: hypothetical protein IKQ29_00615 [Bacilli bacterium]|nr:hypothetical protein [Bacilli bacterium]
MLDYGNDDYDYRRKNNIRKGIKCLSIILVIGGLVVGAGLSGAQETRRARVRDLVRSGISKYDSAYMVLPTDAVISENKDSFYCSGAELVSNIEEKKIKYCQILDEYYTPNGEDIARVEYNLTVREVVNPQSVVLDDKSRVYVAPPGYRMEGTKAVKYSTLVVRRLLPVYDDVDDYLLESFSGINGEVICSELSFIDVVATRPYSDIINADLIADVNDDIEVNNDDNYEAVLRLQSH